MIVSSGVREEERERAIHLRSGTYRVSEVLFLNLAGGGYTSVCSIFFFKCKSMYDTIHIKVNEESESQRRVLLRMKYRDFCKPEK